MTTVNIPTRRDYGNAVAEADRLAQAGAESIAALVADARKLLAGLRPAAGGAAGALSHPGPG